MLYSSPREGLGTVVTVNRRVGRFLVFAVFGLLSVRWGASAVDPADEPRVSIEPRLAKPERADIRVDSSLVLVPVNVTDVRNHVVTNLDANAFRVFDGKTEQRVLRLSSVDQPLSVGIVFDASGSMASKLGKAKEAVAEFLKTADPSDEFFLVNFNGTAQLAMPFTNDPSEIQTHLMTESAHGKTALLDAVYLAMHQMKSAHNPRRALLIISDGGDNDSRYSETELRRAIRESDVWIYAIGIYSRTLMLPEEERGGPRLLTNLAEQTGGRQIEVHNAKELPEAAAQIGQELRHQYLLAYSPDNVERDGKYHRVQVQVVGRRDLRLSWRPGYYAPAQ